MDFYCASPLALRVFRTDDIFKLLDDGSGGLGGGS